MWPALRIKDHTYIMPPQNSFKICNMVTMVTFHARKVKSMIGTLIVMLIYVLKKLRDIKILLAVVLPMRE